MQWYAAACSACGGALYREPEEPSVLTCFLCGRSYQAAAHQLPPVPPPDALSRLLQADALRTDLDEPERRDDLPRTSWRS